MYAEQDKYADAEGLFKRALAIKEKALGADHPDVANSLNNLAIGYGEQGKYADAEGLFKRALAIREKTLGADHPELASTLASLAVVYGKQGKYADAEGLFKRALAIKEKALGQDHPEVANSLIGLAIMYEDQGKYADAQGLYKRALAIREKTLGADHPDVAYALNNLAILSASSGNSENALAYSRKATASVIAHAATETTGAQHKEGAGGLVEQRAAYFVRHVANLAAAAQKRLEPEAQLGREALVMAQWAKQSAAAAAVQQMGLRFAAGTDALAALVRERQDLFAFWRDRDKALLAALVKTARPAEPHRDRRIAQRACCDREQACCQHGAARTGVPRVCGAGEPEAAHRSRKLQNLLGPEEALVFFLTGRQGELRLCADARGFRMENDPARRARRWRRRSRRSGAGSMSMRCGADWNGWSARRPRRTSAACRGSSAGRSLAKECEEAREARPGARGLHVCARPARAVRSRPRA